MGYYPKHDDDARIKPDREEIPRATNTIFCVKTSTSPYRFWEPAWYTSGFQ